MADKLVIGQEAKALIGVDLSSIPDKKCITKTELTDILDSITPNGVYILSTDGKLYDPNKWDDKNNMNAVGVALVTNECKFVISTETISISIKWGDNSTLIENIKTTTDPNEALTDYAGQSNTEQIVNQLGDLTGPDAYAAISCTKYTFKNGKKGYLGAVGELLAIYDNIDMINEAMDIIDAETIPANSIPYQMWSSSQYSPSMAWAFAFNNGSMIHVSKTNISGMRIRALAPL